MRALPKHIHDHFNCRGVIAENYKTALKAKGLTCNVMTPQTAFIKGLFQLTPKG